MRGVISIFLGTFLLAACQTKPHSSNLTPAAPDAIYFGGNGTTVETAVVINLSSDAEAVHSEYSWLSQHCPGFKLKTQGLMAIGQKQYDSMEVFLPDGSERTYYFDITKSFSSFAMPKAN
jgi:hypothetical protein